MSREWEKNIRKITPYVPGEQPQGNDIVKLNTNENPYPPAPGVKKLMEEFECESLRLYPDPDSKTLVNALADYYDVEKDEVFVGVGSDDVLAVAFMTFFNSEKPILFPDITYSFYPVWAELFKIPFERPMLDENFRIKSSDYYKENGGVIIANPNAPTTIYEGLDVIEDILMHNQDCVVIVDEAYIDFGGESAIKLINKYKNLLVVQTFSKSRSMAGLRIGYAIGDKSLIKAMNDVKFSYNSYTMNQPSLRIGVEAVCDDIYFKEMISKIIDTRDTAIKNLTNLGFECLDSKANFIFTKHKEYSAKELFEFLKTKKIYVRYFSLSRIDNYLRITVGTDEQMEKLYRTIEEYIKLKK